MKTWMKWVVAVAAVALLAGGAIRSVYSRKAQQQAIVAQAQRADTEVELAPTDVVKVSSSLLAQSLPVSGPLRAANSAYVKARVAGELQGLTVREGDAVKAGQIIARVDATEYQARVRQAQKQAESARAQVEIAKRSFENNQSLVGQGFISTTALESSLASLNASEATFQAAQAGVDLALKSMEDTVLKAPISGYIAQRLAQPGERVAIDARVVEIVDLGQLEMEASLGASDSLGVQLGQVAQIQVEGTTRPLTARVIRINPSVASASRSVLVYLKVDPAPGLRQGLFAQGSLRTAEIQALSLPLSAVRNDRPVPYVQLIRDGQIIHQNVTTGARAEAGSETVVAITGLSANDLVTAVTVGPLRAGTRVKLLPGPK